MTSSKRLIIGNKTEVSVMLWLI